MFKKYNLFDWIKNYNYKFNSLSKLWNKKKISKLKLGMCICIYYKYIMFNKKSKG